MPPSRLPPSYPPTYYHRTTTVTPSTAHALLQAYIESSEKNPFLHPTSLLSSAGITHGSNSGPTGGLALHHLRRIKAGLNGESLTAETREELEAMFGDPEGEEGKAVKITALSNGESAGDLPPGDDTQVDAVIAASSTVGGEMSKKRTKENNKRKRSDEEISAWAEESSRAGSPTDDAEDLTEFQRSRKTVMGEVGNRDTASKSNGVPPIITKHDHAETPRKKIKSGTEKAARNADKKARRKADVRAKQMATATG